MAQLPLEVKAGIRANAAAQAWPDDFTVQEHVVETQTDAYQQLEGLTGRLARKPVYRRLVSKATEEWPDDFEMRLHTVLEHLAAVKVVARNSWSPAPSSAAAGLATFSASGTKKPGGPVPVGLAPS